MTGKQRVIENIIIFLEKKGQLNDCLVGFNRLSVDEVKENLRIAFDKMNMKEISLFQRILIGDK